MNLEAKQIDIEDAKEIIDLFGPCSSVYECQTPEEITEQVNKYLERNPNENLKDWIKFEIEMEKIFWERQGIFDSKLINDIKERFEHEMDLPRW